MHGVMVHWILYFVNFFAQLLISFNTNKFESFFFPLCLVVSHNLADSFGFFLDPISFKRVHRTYTHSKFEMENIFHTEKDGKCKRNLRFYALPFVVRLDKAMVESIHSMFGALALFWVFVLIFSILLHFANKSNGFFCISSYSSQLTKRTHCTLISITVQRTFFRHFFISFHFISYFFLLFIVLFISVIAVVGWSKWWCFWFICSGSQHCIHVNQ